MLAHSSLDGFEIQQYFKNCCLVCLIDLYQNLSEPFPILYTDS